MEWYSPMFSGHMDKVYVSKVFSFSHDYEYFIDADEVVKGGSGYCIELENGIEVYHAERDKDLPYEIEHIYPDYSIYPELTKDTAFGFLSRGCPRKCSFCHVKSKPADGPKAHKVADLSEFWNGQKNIVICDPNILACKDHMDLLQQLVDSKAKIEINQGLDVRLMNDENLELIKQIDHKSIHLAFDKWEERELVEAKLRMFAEKTGFHRNNGRVIVYILVNFNTTLAEDLYRIQLCRELKFSPFPMIYDKEHCDPIYRKLQRWCCNNFVFWKCESFEEYTRDKTKCGSRLDEDDLTATFLF